MENITKLFCLILLLLPPDGIATEMQAVNTLPSAINHALPIHQTPKLYPEMSDPVLGDQAEIVEWAWSPQYAERFGLEPQPDGLPNGGLWLVGVKIERKQSRNWQVYTCHIIGVMDNKLPILTPPGEMYVYLAQIGYIPGGPKKGSIDLKNEVGRESIKPYSPAQSAWFKFPKNKNEQMYSKEGISLQYLTYYRQFQDGLAFFELDGACGYFLNPDEFRNEIRFPTRFIHENRTAVFSPDAIHFDLPYGLMRRIYPYTVDANDWSSCLMKRAGRFGIILSVHAEQTKRFGNICEPNTQAK